MEISYNCIATHNEQVIGFIIGFFFILEVLAMLIIIGIYFTHNFTGVYFSCLSGFPLTSPYSNWWVQVSMVDTTLHTRFDRHTVTGLWHRRFLLMCADRRYSLYIFVSAVLILPFRSSPYICRNLFYQFLVCLAHVRTKLRLKACRKDPRPGVWHTYCCSRGMDRN